MVKIMKDGVFTIVVENKPKNESLLAEDENWGESSIEKENRLELEKINNNQSILNGTEQLFNYEELENRIFENEFDIEEEEIDYTDPNYILQNLFITDYSLPFPSNNRFNLLNKNNNQNSSINNLQSNSTTSDSISISQTPTTIPPPLVSSASVSQLNNNYKMNPVINLLTVRYEGIELIIKQVLFYIYCGLMPFISKIQQGLVSGMNSRISSALRSNVSSARSNKSDKKSDKNDKEKEKQEFEPIILIIGDGILGIKLIRILSKLGAGSMLRIYTRSEISAEAWIAKGLKASTNIKTLLKSEDIYEDNRNFGIDQADILVLCSESSNFLQLSNLLLRNNVIKATTLIISTMFNISKKKLFQTFLNPFILRTYIQPLRLEDKVLEGLSNNTWRMHEKDSNNTNNKVSTSTTTTTSTSGILSTSSAPSTAPSVTLPGSPSLDQSLRRINNNSTGGGTTPSFADSLAASLLSLSISQKQYNKSDSESSEDEQEIAENEDNESIKEINKKFKKKKKKLKKIYYKNEKDLSLTEISCKYLVERTGNINSLLYLLENYYSIFNLNPNEVRKLSLRSLTGFNEKHKGETLKDIKNIRRNNVTSTLNSSSNFLKNKRVGRLKFMNNVDKVILSLYTEYIQDFHNYLFKYLDINELMNYLETSGIMKLPLLPKQYVKFKKMKSEKNLELINIKLKEKLSDAEKDNSENKKKNKQLYDDLGIVNLDEDEDEEDDEEDFNEDHDDNSITYKERVLIMENQLDEPLDPKELITNSSQQYKLQELTQLKLLYNLRRTMRLLELEDETFHLNGPAKQCIKNFDLNIDLRK